MSSSGITPLNSGPLLIRTYLDGSNNNTYALGLYEKSVSSNRILITSTAGLIAPSDNIYVSSISISSINGLPYPPVDDALWSLVGSTVVNDNPGPVQLTSSLICSSIISLSSINGLPYPPVDDALWSLVGSTIINDNPGPVQLTSSLICSSITSISSIFSSGNLNISSILGTYVAGTQFEYRSQDASTLGTFKIELYGSNLLVYKSTLNGGNATMIQNNGGGPLALGLGSPAIFISTGGANVGILQSNPQYTLDVAGDGYFSSTLCASTICTSTLNMTNGSINGCSSINGGSIGQINQLFQGSPDPNVQLLAPAASALMTFPNGSGGGSSTTLPVVIGGLYILQGSYIISCIGTVGGTFGLTIKNGGGANDTSILDAVSTTPYNPGGPADSLWFPFSAMFQATGTTVSVELASIFAVGQITVTFRPCSLWRIR